MISGTRPTGLRDPGRSGEPLIQETPADADRKHFGTLVCFLAVNLTGGGIPSGFPDGLRGSSWNAAPRRTG
jgi:hypothetical protein